ncbi:ABC transporter substrate-binding protein [Skermania sp. ID1734]|uniref:ABC transporter substrate-binding protein n=1 Tax=Skermania sp. ID1734 TaxID=2597516 RepID=UPI0011811D9B|nr:ABC transporter substrate-binding protein [Skermania sp. ID1734]TSE01429.1 ABC transporter substrate-binding protein [Skermania sp. ID1734]
MRIGNRHHRLGGPVVALTAALAALAAVVALATACSSNPSDPSAGADAVTIAHAQGKTTIDGVPKRIVALGNQWLDATLALGVVPVAYVDNVAVIAGGKTPPWEPASLSQSKALKSSGDITEQVAALNPDLILAPGFMVDKAMYDRLSGVAPTIPGLTNAQIDSWSQQIEVLGKVLHKQGQAKQVIAGVDGKIDAVAQRLPGLRGKTFITTLLASPSQLMVLADPKDGASEVFARLGMHIPQHIVDAAPGGGRLALSAERVGDLDADLVVAAAMGGMEKTFTSLPGYSSLPAVRKKSVAFVNLTDASGLNQPTALSLPYLLNVLEPALANAAQ